MRPVRWAWCLLLSSAASFPLALNAFAGESARLYDTHCALCHQLEGAGLAGQFPRLAGRGGEIAVTEAGRRFLVEVSLFGMAGKIEVDGAAIVGVMPGFALLSDGDIAAILNYVVGLEGPGAAAGSNSDGDKGKRPPISAADVSDVRKGGVLSATQVRDRRDSVLVPNTR